MDSFASLSQIGSLVSDHILNLSLQINSRERKSLAPIPCNHIDNSIREVKVLIEPCQESQPNSCVSRNSKIMLKTESLVHIHVRSIEFKVSICSPSSSALVEERSIERSADSCLKS